MRQVTDLLRRNGYAGYRLPARVLDNPLGNVLVRLGSYFQPRGIGSYLRTHVGRTPRLDNGKIQRELGLIFGSVDESLIEAAADVVRWGHVKAAP